MDESAPVVRLQQQRQFTTLHGRPLTATVGEIRRDGSGAVHATLLLDYETWRTAVEQGSFHLDDVAERPSLDTGEDVELRVRLRSAVTPTLPDDLADVTERRSDPTDPLWHTASWFVTGILQTVSLPEELGLPADLGLPEEFGAALSGGAAASVGVDTSWKSFFAGDDTPDSVRTYVTDYFDADDWTYDRLEAGLIQIDVTLGEDSGFSVYVYTDDETRECLLYAVHSHSVPEDARATVATLLATRNYELEYGSFGLNAASGEVRFRHHVRPDEESFAEAFDATVSTMSSVFGEISEHGVAAE
jgi:hypothetical protein